MQRRRRVPRRARDRPASQVPAADLRCVRRRSLLRAGARRSRRWTSAASAWACTSARTCGTSADVRPRRLYHRDPIAELAEQGASCSSISRRARSRSDKAEVRRRPGARRRHGARPVFLLRQPGRRQRRDSCSTGTRWRATRPARSCSAGATSRRTCSSTTCRTGRWPASVRAGGARRVAPRERHDHRGRLEGPGPRPAATTCASAGSRGRVLGVSGGMDSALTACLAVEALGPGQRARRSSMPTRYSSDHSLTGRPRAGRATSASSYRVIAIDAVFQAHLDALAPSFAGLAPDVTEENIQARVRGDGADGAVEQARRDAADDGQQVGAGRRLLHAVRRHGRRAGRDQRRAEDARLPSSRGTANRSGARIPESTLTKAPSAELRPDQKDTGLAAALRRARSDRRGLRRARPRRRAPSWRWASTGRWSRG